ncbi:hypothetical protein BJ508DRAFT_327724 [Ascobolus immersus RN42]|uniref:Uncharacterized protein n=1 Tax=Ascobolus immersus RN42 TaxID=1160509 RepID=A0A3N4I3L4_ASCIM|nr:hypothetical protein BJ508DRAFT_327724 [Ascobolus immersus RN42]
MAPLPEQHETQYGLTYDELMIPSEPAVVRTAIISVSSANTILLRLQGALYRIVQLNEQLDRLLRHLLICLPVSNRLLLYVYIFSTPKLTESTQYGKLVTGVKEVLRLLVEPVTSPPERFIEEIICLTLSVLEWAPAFELLWKATEMERDHWGSVQPESAARLAFHATEKKKSTPKGISRMIRRVLKGRTKERQASLKFANDTVDGRLALRTIDRWLNDEDYSTVNKDSTFETMMKKLDELDRLWQRVMLANQVMADVELFLPEIKKIEEDTAIICFERIDGAVKRRYTLSSYIVPE